MLDYQIGDKLANRYEIKKVLGVGGMGKVFRARQLELGRDVALKVPSQAVLDSPEVMARFSREAKTVGKLLHDNIVQVYEYYYEDNMAFIAMEFVEGTDLKGLITKPPKDITVGDIATIIEMSCEGLSFAHDNKIVHRDIKPHNIMVARLKRGRWKVKVMDFGIAHIDPAGQFTEVGDGQLTQTGQALGTPSYMAPEQIRGMGVTHLSDIYSIGCVIYYVFARKTIFSGSGLTVAVSHLNEQPPSLLSELPKLPVGLDQLVNACLEKEPENRPKDAIEVGNSIIAALQDIWDQPMAEFWKENLKGQAPIPLAGPSPAEVDETSSSFGESGKLLKVNTEGTSNTMDQDSLLASQENTIVDPQQSRMAQGTRGTIMTDPTMAAGTMDTSLPTKEMPASTSSADLSAAGGTMIEGAPDPATGGPAQGTGDLSATPEKSGKLNVILIAALAGILAIAVGIFIVVGLGGDDKTNTVAVDGDPIIEETPEPQETQIAAVMTPDDPEMIGTREPVATPEPTPSPTSSPTPEPTPSPVPTPSPTPMDLRRNQMKIFSDLIETTDNPLELGKTWKDVIRLYDPEDPEFSEEVLKLTDNTSYKMATSPVMREFPSGAFTMGSENGDPDERPVNSVRLRGFAMGQYEVSALEFTAYLNSNVARSRNLYEARPEFNIRFDEEKNRFMPRRGKELHPANGVSWNVATSYAEWLLSETGKFYSLPTEAQWERAARGRSNMSFPWGNGTPNDTLAQFKTDSTTSIDSFSPGLEGLMNLSGNVSEWVQDWYDPDAYNNPDRQDPTGPSNEEAREKKLLRKVHRGGSFFSYEEDLTVTTRERERPDSQKATIGFRLVRIDR